LLLRWSVGVFNRVAAREVQEGWETLLALLASAILTGSSVGIQTIIELLLIVLNEDRLCRSVHSVVIEGLEQKDSEVSIFAPPGIPVAHMLAAIHNLDRIGPFVV